MAAIDTQLDVDEAEVKVENEVERQALKTRLRIQVLWASQRDFADAASASLRQLALLCSKDYEYTEIGFATQCAIKMACANDCAATVHIIWKCLNELDCAVLTNGAEWSFFGGRFCKLYAFRVAIGNNSLRALQALLDLRLGRCTLGIPEVIWTPEPLFNVNQIPRNENSHGSISPWLAGNSVLYDACRAGRAKAVELLIRAKARVDVGYLSDAYPESYDKDLHRSWTPMHCSAAHGHTDCVRVLLRAKADANVVFLPEDYDFFCDQGRQPLHVAIENGNVGAVKVLLRARVQLHVADRGGYTPLQLACRRVLVSHDEEEDVYYSHDEDGDVEDEKEAEHQAHQEHQEHQEPIRKKNARIILAAVERAVEHIWS